MFIDEILDGFNALTILFDDWNYSLESRN